MIRQGRVRRLGLRTVKGSWEVSHFEELEQR
jgi:hypothetical protein